jgi:KDO2-lipid IV(A) lauroyltransferase
MDFQKFATSEFGTKLWMGAAGGLPRTFTYAIARLITGVLARRRNSVVYRLLAENQAAVLGDDVASERVHQAVGAVLRHAGMVSVDLMYYVAKGEAAIRRALAFPPAFWTDINAARATGRGVLVCGIHLSNFNLGFLSFALQGFPLQVLSSAAPVGGFKIMHELRARGVLEETPIDSHSLRAAIARLRAGGAAATGVDWPVNTGRDEWIPFFGRPARMPTGHIRVAMSANAVILPIACRWTAEEGYYVMSQPHLELELTGNREADVRHNARRVLAHMERWIAETPEQWLMYHRVWGED